MGMNVYDVINSRIEELLLQNVVPWKRSWSVKNSMPRSLVTMKPYKGINLFLLASQQYRSPYWLSFKAVQDRGGKVRKGERATPICFWKILDKPDPDNHDKLRKHYLLKHYNIFSVEQCDGLVYPEHEDEINDFSPIEAAEQIIANMPTRPIIIHGGNKAYYSISTDEVHLPPQTAFESPDEYYVTCFHEISHSTLAEHRLNRKATTQVHSFGDEAYSKEELVASMGECYLASHAGIVQKTIENSAAYIQGWLKALKNDKTLLVQAGGMAQKSSDYILNVNHDEPEE